MLPDPDATGATASLGNIRSMPLAVKDTRGRRPQTAVPTSAMPTPVTSTTAASTQT